MICRAVFDKRPQTFLFLFKTCGAVLFEQRFVYGILDFALYVLHQAAVEGCFVVEVNIKRADGGIALAANVGYGRLIKTVLGKKLARGFQNLVHFAFAELCFGLCYAFDFGIVHVLKP